MCFGFESVLYSIGIYVGLNVLPEPRIELTSSIGW